MIYLFTTGIEPEMYHNFYDSLTGKILYHAVDIDKYFMYDIENSKDALIDAFEYDIMDDEYENHGIYNEELNVMLENKIFEISLNRLI